MASSDDPSGYRNAFETELGRLNDLPYDPDARAIRTWANQMTHEYSTRENRVVNARKLSKRAAEAGLPPLTEMSSVDEFYELHDTLRDGSNPDVKDDGLAESTLRNIRGAARRFFGEATDVEWYEEIQVGAAPESKVTADDIYVADEVTTLFEATRNARDKALMATLLATGLRISAVLSIQRDDVDLEGQTGFVHVTDEAIGMKGFAGERPLLWATEYVKNWMDVHPVKEPKAALFCPIKDQKHPERNGPGDPLSPWGVNQQLRRVKSRAVDAGAFPEHKAVNPHNFRHSAITRMVRDGLSEPRIKWLVGWDEDSGQLARYSHLRDDEHMAGVLEHYDLEPEDAAVGKPSLVECPSCGAILDDWVNPKACPGCGVSLSDTAADLQEAAEDVQEDVTETALTEDLTTEERAGLRILKDLADDPSLLAARLAELDE